VFSSHISDKKKSMIADHDMDDLKHIRKGVMAALISTDKPSVPAPTATLAASVPLRTCFAHPAKCGQNAAKSDFGVLGRAVWDGMGVYACVWVDSVGVWCIYTAYTYKGHMLQCAQCATDSPSESYY